MLAMLIVLLLQFSQNLFLKSVLKQHLPTDIAHASRENTLPIGIAKPYR